MVALKSGTILWVAGLATVVWAVAAIPAAAQGPNSSSACPKLQNSVRASFDETLTGLASARAAIKRASDNPSALAPLVDSIAAAKADCGKMVADKTGRGNIWAYECLGDAAYLLARHRSEQPAQQRDADYFAAQCAYVAEAALLAKVTDSREQARKRERSAVALEGQGRALLGRSELGGADASRYLSEAITAYSAAADLQPTVQRYLALARGQAASGNGRGASDTYEKLQKLAPDPANFPDSLRAAALREQARIQQKDVGTFGVASVRELWNRARGLDSTAESHFNYAKTYFDAGDVAAARTAFGEAAGARNEPGGAINYVTEGAYYVAVIDARSASSSAQWANVLTNVQKAGPGDARYRRLACMAYIRRGGEALTKDALTYRDGAPGSCSGEDTAEGQLLRGMYMLRLAQYLPLTCSRANNPDCPASYDYKGRLSERLNGAAGAFQRGTALAANEAAFNWLEQQSASAPKLKETLVFGDALANKLSRIDGCKGAPPTGAASAVDVFNRLDLIGCTPSAN